MEIWLNSLILQMKRLMAKNEVIFPGIQEIGVWGWKVGLVILMILLCLLSKDTEKMSNKYVQQKILKYIGTKRRMTGETVSYPSKR